MYRMPSFLWSTVTTQSCSLSPMGLVETPAGFMAKESEAMSIPLLSSKGPEIGDQRVKVAIVQFHCRHQGSFFHRVGILDPLAEIVGGIWCDPGRDGVATHQVSQIGAKATASHGSPNGMAIDATG